MTGLNWPNLICYALQYENFAKKIWQKMVNFATVSFPNILDPAISATSLGIRVSLNLKNVFLRPGDLTPTVSVQ